MHRRVAHDYNAHYYIANDAGEEDEYVDYGYLEGIRNGWYEIRFIITTPSHDCFSLSDCSPFNSQVSVGTKVKVNTENSKTDGCW